ncbi:Stp1/IreP family PP2C-type Ser/Thr phosphatase [Peribacillus deserti]|uniref:protein-serine/threonine phosphatase n=1 Tax=Peribacillus deserti TaxID=673318 RepID=A0A2N5M711_9BACI|nr:Stp1/IreP family PP2C-type Ser/Thr phosphatase [Peribacillus deserti]PLT30112.1 protein phosphatase [Peribacillus deserti]
MEAVFKTDRGKLRQLNEDNGGVFTNPSGVLLAVVADGMGGHRAGDVASSMAIEKLKDFWAETGEFLDPEDAEDWLRIHIVKVNDLLYQHSLANKECEGMGTTIVAAICTRTFASVAHVGDSRGYLYQNSGIKQVTEDHSLVQELVRCGQISKEDAEHHPRKNVLLRALGTEKNVEIDVSLIPIYVGDMLLLCSDGLSNKVSENDLQQIITAQAGQDVKSEDLIKLANDNGGEDNITLVLVHFTDESESG